MMMINVKWIVKIVDFPMFVAAAASITAKSRVRHIEIYLSYLDFVYFW